MEWHSFINFNLKVSQGRSGRMWQWDGKVASVSVVNEREFEALIFFSGEDLLHKSVESRATPIPGRTYPIRTVYGVPSVVKGFRNATQI